jgi:predicted outer membrane repeat protein
MAVQMQHDTTFSSNTAARNGGAIYVARALLEMTSTRLSHNAVNVTAKMPVTSAGGGGLFCSECTLTIHDSKFTHNNATLGGGVALLRAKSANITSTRFDGNTATSSAGGSPAAMSDTQAISTSGEHGVSYLGGGGLYLETEECKLANLTFTQNTAPVAGGC